MKHPRRDYTLEDALSLARDIRYGPLPKPTDPMPTVDEAIQILSDRRLHDFNWITGQTALQVLRAGRGGKIKASGPDTVEVNRRAGH